MKTLKPIECDKFVLDVSFEASKLIHERLEQVHPQQRYLLLSRVLARIVSDHYKPLVEFIEHKGVETRLVKPSEQGG